MTGPITSVEEGTKAARLHTWIGDDCPEGWRRVGSIDVADPADTFTARDRGFRIGTVYNGRSGSVAEPCCADTYTRTELGERAEELEWKVADLNDEVAFQKARATTAESEVSRLTERLAKVEAERDEARNDAQAAEVGAAFDRAFRVTAESTASSLAERVKSLEAALRPFCFGDPVLEQILFGGMPDDAQCNLTVRLGHTRAARAALKGASDD